jgi:ribose/xylose/arabinose/galactoside ABC-type transport system permease subunit
LKVIFVALVAGLMAGCLAAVLIAAFGGPLFIAALAAGAGAGAAAMSYYRRVTTPDAPA